MRAPSLRPARELWVLYEPIHAAIYFAKEAREEYDAAGTKGGWMGYFASRSAPMGAVGPEVVTATFYNFHPAMVRRAIPDAWSLSTPEKMIRARYNAAARIMQRSLGGADPDAVQTAGQALSDAVAACRPEGRTLFAATAGLEAPDDQAMRLWHAATCMREFRGDGHVSTLLQEGIDGCEAHVLMAAAGRVDPAAQRAARGWSEQEWDEARLRLVERSLLAADGSFSVEGAALHAHVEEQTDRLSMPPLIQLGEDRCKALLDALRRVVGQLVSEVPYPNPIGIEKPQILKPSASTAG